MRKLVFLLLSLVCLIADCLGQINWKEGYIITNEGDSIRGEINFRTIAKSYDQCEFRNQNTQKIYTSREISGYGINEDRHYKSFPDELKFGEILVIGELSLFRINEEFMLIKGGEYTRLSVEEKTSAYAGYEVNTEDIKWKGIFSAVLGDCRTITDDELKNLRFDERVITREVVEYNKCKNAPYQEYKVEKKWTSIKFSLMAGLANSILKPKPANSNYYYISSSYSSIDPQIGISMYLFYPRISDRFYFEIAAMYTGSSFSGFEQFSGSTSEYHDVFINTKSLSTPVTIGLILPFNKWMLTVNSGIHLENIIESSSIHYGEVLVGNTVNAYPEEAPFAFKKSIIGFTGGVGLKRGIGKRELQVQLRYAYLNNVSANDDLAMKLQRLSLNLNLIL